MKDRTLAVFVGLGYYHFTTYNIDKDSSPNVIKNVKYGENFDNEWNFIHFGYKREGKNGQAKGYVYFSEKEGDDKTVEVSFSVLHDYIINYFHFVIGKEFKYLAFNG